MLSLLFAGFFAFAGTDQNTCAVYLAKDGETIPAMEIALSSKANNLFPSDEVAAAIEWPKLFGRSIRVIWKLDGRIVSSSQQDVFSRDGLIKNYPDLGSSVNQVLGTFNEGRSKLERTFTYRCLRPILKNIGFRTGVSLAERCLPGEFGQLVFRMPTELWESEQLSSWSQSKTVLGKLFIIDITTIILALKQKIKDFAYDYNSLPRPLLRVYFVHNHPGIMDPLSVLDLRAQEAMADHLSRQHDMFDFELIFVALAHSHEPGDVAFVRAVSRIQGNNGQSSTWTADGEERTYEFGGRNRLKPKLNPPRRRREMRIE